MFGLGRDPQDRRRNQVAGGLLLVLVLAALVIGQHRFAVEHLGGNDSLPRWLGTRAWLFEGQNPYSDEIGEASRRLSSRTPSDVGVDQMLFVYPFYTVFVYLPFMGMTFEWARAVWMVLLEAALAGMILLGARCYRWSPPAWLVGLTLAWSILFYNGFRTIILWQLAGFSAVLIAAALWALKRERDWLVGACLALASVKPQMVLLIIPAIALWSLTLRRWKVLASLAVSFAVLFGLSFLLLPSWLADMLRQMNSYVGYTEAGGSIAVLTTFAWPSLGQPVAWALMAACLSWLVWEWWSVRGVDGPRADFALTLTLVMSNVVIARTSVTNQVMMLPALVYLFALAERRFGAASYGWIAAGLVAYLVAAWALFAWVIVAFDSELWPTRLPFPLLLLLGMLIARRAVPAADVPPPAAAT